ncbi:plasmid transfer protein TraA [Streptomyces sp. NPDC006326]|uniref:plasmid transfer protein TraA n=1 Tax=Streptomyces sp. NPDC006326 TaxID=3156752 RepID=UPI0033BC5702
MSTNSWMPTSGNGAQRPGNPPAGGQRRTTPQGGGQQSTAGQGGANRSRTTNRSKSREYHFHINDNSGGPRSGSQQGGRAGQGRGQGGGGRVHSPLGDPEFFSNVDIRNYCESGRGLFLQMSFELANAAELLNAVLKEVPDPEGRPFGSRMRARRVSKRLQKAAEDARDTAKNLAATYAAFQREFDPELAPYQSKRPRQGGRRFDFGS